MGNEISTISSVITIILFVLYIIGHLWKSYITRNIYYEKFKVVNIENANDIYSYDLSLRIDDKGQIFSISSIYGIRKIKIYNVNCNFDKNFKLHIERAQQISEYNNLGVNDELYIQCDLGETIPLKEFEIQRSDYTIFTFHLYQSGKTGDIHSEYTSVKMTWRSWLYYLCI